MLELGTIIATITTQSLTHSFFFFNDTATTEIYTLSLHDALPICDSCVKDTTRDGAADGWMSIFDPYTCPLRMKSEMPVTVPRSEEHTSELQSPCNLVCRLLLEKKKPTDGPSSLKASKRLNPSKHC